MYPFQENGIDGVQLSQMVEEDLENLGIPKVFDKLIYHLSKDQFRYIKIQPNAMDFSTRLWEINPTNSVVNLFPQNFVLRSIVLA